MDLKSVIERSSRHKPPILFSDKLLSNLQFKPSRLGFMSKVATFPSPWPDNPQYFEYIAIAPHFYEIILNVLINFQKCM